MTDYLYHNFLPLHEKRKTDSDWRDVIDFHLNRGKYFTPIATETKPSKAARDSVLAKQLWKISEDFVKLHDNDQKS